jgi:hypothetical protein
MCHGVGWDVDTPPVSAETSSVENESGMGSALRRTFRPKGSYIAAGALALIGVGKGLIPLVYGLIASASEDLVPAALVCVLLFGVSARMFLLRVETGQRQVKISNLLRTHAIPWSAVERFELNRRLFPRDASPLRPGDPSPPPPDPIAPWPVSPRKWPTGIAVLRDGKRIRMNAIQQPLMNSESQFAADAVRQLNEILGRQRSGARPGRIG